LNRQFFRHNLHVMRLRLQPVAPIAFQEPTKLLPEEFPRIPKSRMQISWPGDILDRIPANQSIYSTPGKNVGQFPI